MFQLAETSAGPNQRAGFSAAPVIGPTEKIMALIVNPIGKPGRDAATLLLSTATPKITNTNNEVPKISAKAAALVDVGDTTDGNP